MQMTRLSEANLLRACDDIGICSLHPNPDFEGPWVGQRGVVRNYVHVNLAAATSRVLWVGLLQVNIVNL